MKAVGEVNRFLLRNARTPDDPPPGDDLICGDPTDVEFLLRLLIKAADLGHSAKELSLHKKWSARIVEEFFMQGDEEASLGLPVSAFMSRAEENTPKNQGGFFKFIVLDFYEKLHELFPREFAEPFRLVKKNMEFWTKLEADGVLSISDAMGKV